MRTQYKMMKFKAFNSLNFPPPPNREGGEIDIFMMHTSTLQIHVLRICHDKHSGMLPSEISHLRIGANWAGEMLKVCPSCSIGLAQLSCSDLCSGGLSLSFCRFL
jgi:hypothetical protein